MWATLIAAGFFALVVLVVLLRADKTMANCALAVIALLAIGIAASLTVRGAAPTARPMELIAEARVPPAARTAALPALSCLDGLAGESVEAACEQAVDPGLANTMMTGLSRDDIAGTAAGAARQVRWDRPMDDLGNRLSRALGSLLFGVKELDLRTFLAMSLSMVAVGLLASYLPARRASTVDPIESLRGD